jgi:hypothetical protein
MLTSQRKSPHIFNCISAAHCLANLRCRDLWYYKLTNYLRQEPELRRRLKSITSGPRNCNQIFMVRSLAAEALKTAVMASLGGFFQN